MREEEKNFLKAFAIKDQQIIQIKITLDSRYFFNSIKSIQDGLESLNLGIDTFYSRIASGEIVEDQQNQRMNLE